MKRLLLLLSLVLTCLGVSAETISMTYGNGTLSGKTCTSNAASGVAGLKIAGYKTGYMEAVGTTANSYYYLTAAGTTTSNYTITAPSGWKLTGYSITFKSTSTKYYVYGRTAQNVSSSNYTARSIGSAATMSVTGQSASTLEFSFKNADSSGRVQATAFTVTLEAEGEAADVSWSAATGTWDAETQTGSLPTLNNTSGVSVP